MAAEPCVRITSEWIGGGWYRVKILMPWDEVVARSLSGDMLNLRFAPNGPGHYTNVLLARDADDLRVEFDFRTPDWRPDPPRFYMCDMEVGQWR
jgi:hypothetical protein